MSNEVYLDQLISSLSIHKQNVLTQKGKSDLDPCDYMERVEAWYLQIIEYVSANPPEYYVKSLNVFQDSNQMIRNVLYNYSDECDYKGSIAINIY